MLKFADVPEVVGEIAVVVWHTQAIRGAYPARLQPRNRWWPCVPWDIGYKMPSSRLTYLLVCLNQLRGLNFYLDPKFQKAGKSRTPSQAPSVI